MIADISDDKIFSLSLSLYYYYYHYLITKYLCYKLIHKRNYIQHNAKI